MKLEEGWITNSYNCQCMWECMQLVKNSTIYWQAPWTEGGPAGACYGVSPSGWMEEVNLLKWFELQFYPFVNPLTASGPISQAQPATCTQGMRGSFTCTAVCSIQNGTSETHRCVELRGYFRELLKPNEPQKSQRHRHVHLECTGEVLTSDEVVEHIERAEEEKAAKCRAKKGKKKGSKGQAACTASPSVSETESETRCHRCGEVYTDDQAEDWIGCDDCESWWHYWCDGLSQMITAAEEWVYEDCRISLTTYTIR